METELGYKIRSKRTGLFKHRAGGILWSEQGDIYYSLPKVKAVLQSHLKRGRRITLTNEELDQYEILEYEIKPTGKVL